MGKEPPSNRTAHFVVIGISVEKPEMTEFVNEINYDKLIEKALKQVVVEALKIAETQGLPGENHFYITFRTNHPGTIIPRDLLIQYPDSMTIVLQHQYSNLEVGTDSISVEPSANSGRSLRSHHLLRRPLCQIRLKLLFLRKWRRPRA